MITPDEEPINPAHTLFEHFVRARQCQEVLSCFVELCQHLGLRGNGLQLYHSLKTALNFWSAKALWSKLDKKAGHKDYDQGTACTRTKCLVVGAGPCGLRTAIELALLGARVVLLEKRDSFSRNNVLHLWPFTIHDLRALGAKKFYGRFCTGTLDHISIRQLQLILLKVALLLGVEVHTKVEFKGLQLPTGKAAGQGGWRAVLQPSSSPLSHYEFDVLISAGGGKFVPEGFKRKEMRGKLAIGITTNFINRYSQAEVEVAEISGVARIYNQKFFQNLYNKTGIDLENIVYYKDDTHYFVMTAKKQSLLKKGVILQDKADIESLLSPDNVNWDALLSYAKEAANFSTNYCLPELEFALNHRNQPDVDMFDFTCMTRSENAALVREHNGARLLLGLVGDCLVEPFWPLGTGVARGFLAAFDAAWMVRRWAAGTPPLEVLAERESIYQRLSQTSPDNTNKNVAQYSIDPTTRYPNLNLQAIRPSQVRDFYLIGKVEVDHEKKIDNRLSTAVCGDTYKELLRWCQDSTDGYHGVEVTDFTSSWTSGLALCALIHRFRPHLVDFDAMDPQDPIRTHQLMLDVAEQELGIQPILSSAEMASMAEPNRLGLITYLSQFYEAFKPPPPASMKLSKKPRSPCGTKGAILFLSKLQKNCILAHKHTQASVQKDAEGKKSNRDSTEIDAVPSGNTVNNDHDAQPAATMDPAQTSVRPESSDACYFCARRVYILERASAEGLFFHRSCFQCWRCGATLRLGDYAFNEEDGHFYCSLHFPDTLSMELPLREPPVLLPDKPSMLPDGDAVTDHVLSDAGSPCASPEQEESGPPPTSPQPPGELKVEEGVGTGEMKDSTGTGEIVERELLPLGMEDTMEEDEKSEGPSTEPQKAVEDSEESGGRRKIILSDLEKLHLSSLSLMGDTEAEPPPKPARLRLQAPLEAMLGVQAQVAWEEEKEEEEAAMEEDLEESDSEEEEEEEGSDLGIVGELNLIVEGTEKYPVWKRTLDRRAREAQMKRFCKAQAIQRRLEEIEVTFRELEQQGIKLEKFLREDSDSPADQKTQWMNQLLYLVQKKNSLMLEESDLMITVQELKLEEQQWQLDRELRWYIEKEEALKTPEDHAAEQQILAQLLKVVDKRNALIHMQEEKRLSELHP
ncbi:F-actin-monooxygenase MICAL1 isoform X1 [Tympanuchus pallidicinctus]|uniref:F-actin-monooxygenase MICAL1 isoform X1 n=1 Tax=Tympanuchus pallidicinctus TaxID=109042 RepID=UPI0022871681|nr:F-actin-monooxygenase MICAL1 isoform X1 [Tympanuchus pallidicinctus]XP_052558342.1 F-actin-monooxygenase MICAL1 isoform X1 [Tympanuchus pallidicinctus]XP_052558343.1 F-actin-monooxygenase MICAL1 isoform X1 [Tympanuchus pallidicinctus]